MSCISSQAFHMWRWVWVLLLWLPSIYHKLHVPPLEAAGASGLVWSLGWPRCSALGACFPPSALPCPCAFHHVEVSFPPAIPPLWDGAACCWGCAGLGPACPRSLTHPITGVPGEGCQCSPQVSPKCCLYLGKQRLFSPGQQPTASCRSVLCPLPRGRCLPETLGQEGFLPSPGDNGLCVI